MIVLTSTGLTSSHLGFWVLSGQLALGALTLGSTGSGNDEDEHAPKMDSRATQVEHVGDQFRDWLRAPRPGTAEWQRIQEATYGDKHKINTPRPLLEAGRRLYDTRPVDAAWNLFGDGNLLFPHLYVYGDWRTAAGYSDLGPAHTSRLATRLNLDVDLGITATERIHALIRPLDRNTEFTQVGFSGLDDGTDELLLDGNLETLFFEGDLGAMFGGPAADSIPIALGKVPLLFQNGVWVEDAFTGVAVSFPAKNSKTFDIANYDWTVFAAFDDVTTGAERPGATARPAEDTNILGITGFLETMGGYWEVGYAYADIDDGLSYHNITAAFSQRFGKLLSNSVRVIANVGQDPDGNAAETADGILVLIENSFITNKPYTVLPYLNLFAGFGTPQSLARDGGAGGVLKNTGLNFEVDAITAFPSLDATGHDATGAALGIQYLFELDRQLVLEVAGQHAHGDDAKALGDEFGVGMRFQQPIPILGRRTALLRVDAMYGTRENGDDISGVRLEFRWKF